jgi:hypothetical protein
MLPLRAALSRRSALHAALHCVGIALITTCTLTLVFVELPIPRPSPSTSSASHTTTNPTPNPNSNSNAEVEAELERVVSEWVHSAAHAPPSTVTHPPPALLRLSAALDSEFAKSRQRHRPSESESEKEMTTEEFRRSGRGGIKFYPPPPPPHSSSWCSLITTTGGAALCAPSFVVIGAFKAGTTSLYSWLAAHPGMAQALGVSREVGGVM